MALLQISEPGMSAAPHQHRLAVGIDLGTTNSLVATVRSGSAVCLPDSDGRATLPSVVRYLDGEVEVGKNALSAQKTDPLNTISSAKRLIGRTLTDLAQEAQYLPYRFTPNERVVELNTRQGAKRLSKYRQKSSKPSNCAPKNHWVAIWSVPSLLYPLILTMPNRQATQRMPHAWQA